MEAPRSLPVLVLATAAVLGGCVHADALRCDAGSRAMVQERLYFGTQRPAGTAVSDAEWRGFVDAVVAPAFPDGFTTWDAAGGWRGADGRTVREASHVLEVVRPSGAGAVAEDAVGKVAADYAARFGQEAVMRTRTATCVSF